MKNWLLNLLALLLSELVIFRAVSLPITHDEASTWLNYRHLNVWSCMSNPACWGTANNHWLNTLLLQCSAGFFGDVPWALRLPNVLAGISYMVCAILLSSRYIRQPLLQCVGFALLCGHVYLLDFFSLARGYGMMAAGVLWGIYAMLRYIESYKFSWLVLALSSLMLAILANFTSLLPWAAIGLGWLIWILLEKKFSLILRHGSLWLVQALLLLLLLHFPIKMLAQSGEFGWGAKNIWLMSSDLVINLLYGERIFGERSATYILIALGCLGALLIYLAWFKKNLPGRVPVLFMALLVLLNFMVIVLDQTLTGSLAPVGRKSIYLIPFVFGFFVVGLSFIQSRIISTVAAVLIACLLLYRIPINVHTNYCREWYTDGNYPELLATILPNNLKTDSVRVSSSWIFNPPLTFYQKTIPLPISGLPYQRPLVIDSTMDYYYVEASDSTGMNQKGFVLYRNIGYFYLFKNSHFVK